MALHCSPWTFGRPTLRRVASFVKCGGIKRDVFDPLEMASIRMTHLAPADAYLRNRIRADVAERLSGRLCSLRQELEPAPLRHLQPARLLRRTSNCCGMVWVAAVRRKLLRAENADLCP